MQKSEKTAEPSMEEILASIRKIIAEEPPQDPEATPAAPVARSEPLDAAMKDLVGPPGDYLSDMLDEPAQQEAPAEPAQLAAAASGLADLGAEAAKPEIEAAKSPFTQADDPGESPLMARLPFPCSQTLAQMPSMAATAAISCGHACSFGFPNHLMLGYA